MELEKAKSEYFKLKNKMLTTNIKNMPLLGFADTFAHIREQIREIENILTEVYYNKKKLKLKLSVYRIKLGYLYLQSLLVLVYWYQNEYRITQNKNKLEIQIKMYNQLKDILICTLSEPFDSEEVEHVQIVKEELESIEYFKDTF